MYLTATGCATGTVARLGDLDQRQAAGDEGQRNNCQEPDKSLPNGREHLEPPEMSSGGLIECGARWASLSKKPTAHETLNGHRYV